MATFNIAINWRTWVPELKERILLLWINRSDEERWIRQGKVISWNSMKSTFVWQHLTSMNASHVFLCKQTYSLNALQTSFFQTVCIVWNINAIFRPIPYFKKKLYWIWPCNYIRNAAVVFATNSFVEYNVNTQQINVYTSSPAFIPQNVDAILPVSAENIINCLS